MKYCPNCGNQINENEAFCPKCGTKMGDKSETNQQQKPTSGPKPRVENRNTVMNIILTIVTCGIYGIIWFINMVNDVNTVTQDEQSNQSGGTVFLLSLITCGIYGIIWFYQAGKRMETAGQKYGLQIADNSVIYIVLQLVGLGIVGYYLLQTDLNKFSE